MGIVAFVLGQLHWLHRLVHVQDSLVTTTTAVIPRLPSTLARVKDTPNVHRSSMMYNQTHQDKGVFLVFLFPSRLTGQGIGNILSGLLAAHLLAEEFGRTVCHAEEATHESEAELPGSPYRAFRLAFDWRDPSHRQNCDRFLRLVQQPSSAGGAVSSPRHSYQYSAPNQNNTIVYNNYDPTTSEQSECVLQELLSNKQDAPVVYYQGNSYPRWPQTDARAGATKRDYFRDDFVPTNALRKILFWTKRDSNRNSENDGTLLSSTPPATIVHLRHPDGVRDARHGLDNQTFALLRDAKLVPEGEKDLRIGLVTNHLRWHERFPDWSVPNYWSDSDTIRHSALDRIAWDGTSSNNRQSDQYRDRDAESLKMLGDWYALLTSETLYHTHSDFSRSASRWNQRIQSWTLRGVETTDTIHELVATSDSDPGRVLHLGLRAAKSITAADSNQIWVPRLVNRTADTLWFCGNSSQVEAAFVREKRDQQLLDLIRARQRQRGTY